MEELKPCPFCNRKVSIKKVSIPFDAVGSAKIAQCECRSEERRVGKECR